MELTRQQIYHNYHECLGSVRRLLEKRYAWNRSSDDLLEELAQSVTGDEQVVELLRHEPFDPDLHRSFLLERIDAIRTLLLPDLKKKQFVSLSDVSWTLQDAGHAEEYPPDKDPVSPDNQPHLSDEARAVLETFRKKSPVRVRALSATADALEEIERKLLLAETFFPEGNIPPVGSYAINKALTTEQITDCYKCVYIGIEPQFPPQFLQFEGDKRAAVLMRFLINHILETSPEEVLYNHSIDILSRHRLHNIARYFNYSLNRALGNAYPDLILPWLNSRIPDKYWENPANRTEAVRWLVEQVLQLNPDTLRSGRIKRTHFSRNGLSFLYNSYYNSVSRALREAYPFLRRWELGSVPFEYWDSRTAAEAIRWLVDRKNWSPEQLPHLIRTGAFSRKTFSEYGLATLFEKKFRKNFYLALNCAYPDRFMPWELGKVSSEYWKDPQHLFNAARWIALKEGIPITELMQAVESNRITISTFQKYSIGSALKRFSYNSLTNLFWPQFREEQQIRSGHVKLLRKLNALIDKETGRKTLLRLLLYGFYSGLHQSMTRPQTDRLVRMQNRIRRRQKMQSYTVEGWK